MKAIFWEEDGFLLLNKVLTGYQYSLLLNCGCIGLHQLDSMMGEYADLRLDSM